MSEPTKIERLLTSLREGTDLSPFYAEARRIVAEELARRDVPMDGGIEVYVAAFSAHGGDVVGVAITKANALYQALRDAEESNDACDAVEVALLLCDFFNSTRQLRDSPYPIAREFYYRTAREGRDPTALQVLTHLQENGHMAKTPLENFAPTWVTWKRLADLQRVH